jgi:hypothetical protein
MIDVVSSNLARIGYAPEARNLYVEFKNGKRWLYRNVPPDLYQELSTSTSPGGVFARKIRDHFDANPIETDGEPGRLKMKIGPTKTTLDPMPPDLDGALQLMSQKLEAFDGAIDAMNERLDGEDPSEPL